MFTVEELFKGKLEVTVEQPNIDPSSFSYYTSANQPNKANITLNGRPLILKLPKFKIECMEFNRRSYRGLFNSGKNKEKYIEGITIYHCWYTYDKEVYQDISNCMEYIYKHLPFKMGVEPPKTNQNGDGWIRVQLSDGVRKTINTKSDATVNDKNGLFNITLVQYKKKHKIINKHLMDSWSQTVVVEDLHSDKILCIPPQCSSDIYAEIVLDLSEQSKRKYNKFHVILTQDPSSLLNKTAYNVVKTDQVDNIVKQVPNDISREIKKINKFS